MNGNRTSGRGDGSTCARDDAAHDMEVEAERVAIWSCARSARRHAVQRFKTLVDDDRVQFRIVQGQKGPAAKKSQSSAAEYAVPSGVALDVIGDGFDLRE